MAEDNNHLSGLAQDRRAVVARYGHFRIDRVWFRTERLSDPSNSVHYRVRFEVDAGVEFGLGGFGGSRGRGTLSATDLRRFAFYLASLWRRAHSPPPETRPKSVPYYRRARPEATHNRETPEEWIQDFTLRMPDQPTIDVDEAAALIETAMHELDENEIKDELSPEF